MSLLASSSVIEIEMSTSFAMATALFVLANIWMVSLYKIFEKAGESGGKAFVPILNILTLLELIKRPGWWVFLLLLPGINLVAALVICMDTAALFRKDKCFGVGLLLFPQIVWPVLGFGSAEYQGVPEDDGVSLWSDAWRRLSQNRMALASSVVFVVIIYLCVFGPMVFSGHSGEANNLENAFQKPSFTHWFGTDDLGRDIFVRTLEGGRISLVVGFLATAVSLVIGVVYGSFAGYIGGRTDAFLMRIVDILYSLPFTIFVILLMVLFGRNFILLFVAIGFVEWLTMARIVRAQIMALKDTEFVESARALGYGNLRIIFGHLLPNILGPVIIYASLTVPAVMLLEAVLSFLGLGVQPPMSSWGLLIKDGAEKIDVYPWLLIFPALFFSATLFSLNFIGDGLRDALDPKSSKD